MANGRRLLSGIALGLVVALAGVACGSGGDQGGTGKTGGTLKFGASADPTSFDPAYISDGESIRITYQIFESLMRTKLGGFDPEPLLAKSYSVTPDGLKYTFNLQQNVKFHDGTPFNADAVCYNFNRWYNFKGVQQSDSVSYYWVTVFGGFSDKPASSLYKSCEAKDQNTAVITLTHPSSTFIAAMTLPSFSIASPTALKQYNADKVTGTAEAPKFEGEFGISKPVGTGPFKLESYTPKDRVVLARNEDYWGTKASLDKVIFRTISDGAARRQALETGELDIYDNVSPEDITTLKSKQGFQVLQRPPFNVGYVGFQQTKPPLNNPKIRQAIAYALNRQALVTAKYAPGAEVAKEFMPPGMFGYAADVQTYDYDLAKAKQLITESGVKNPTLDFWYPSGVSRGYMPDPQANFQAFKSDLEKAGFKVNAHSSDWQAVYKSELQAGKYPVYLFGWLADFGDPDNFVGVFFQTKQQQWGYDNAALRKLLDDAEAEPDQQKRIAMYQQANKIIMTDLPGVPYVHTSTYLGARTTVKNYVPSPIALEPLSAVTLG
jgi:peptide/nickel transport system substrate-binding protein